MSTQTAARKISASGVVVRVLTILLGVIALGTGVKAIGAGLGPGTPSALLDNHYRYYGGIWLAAGPGLLYCVARLRESAQLFRFLMFAIMVGGVGRAIGVMQLGPERPMLIAIAIELLVPALLLTLYPRATAS